MFLAAGIGIVINLFIGFSLQKESHTLNTRAAMLHVFGDVGASAGVIAAGIIILFTGWTIADPVLSIGIAALIGVGPLRILRETAAILMEAAPKGLSTANLATDVKNVGGLHDVN